MNKTIGSYNKQYNKGKIEKQENIYFKSQVF